MNWNNLSKKKKTYIALFGTAVGIMLWAFVSAGIITHNFNRSQLAVDKDRKEALINGIVLTETKQNKKYWELYGETGTYDSKNALAIMDNVVGNFYKDNSVAMSFQSSKGSYDSEKKIITLYENTFIVMKDGTTLKADNLVYVGNDEPIKANGNVKITRGKQFLALADEIEISPNYDSFKIKGNTTSKIYEEKR